MQATTVRLNPGEGVTVPGARAKTWDVGGGSSRPPGHLKPQGAGEPKVASDSELPGQRGVTSIGWWGAKESEGELTKHGATEKNQVARRAHLAHWSQAVNSPQASFF